MEMEMVEMESTCVETMTGNKGQGTQSLFGHMNKTRKDKTPSGAKINGGH